MMEVGFEFVFLICATFLISFFGIALFRIGKQELEKVQRAKVEEEHLKLNNILWIICMFTGNLILTAFLSAFFHSELLEVIKTITVCTILWVCAWTDWKQFLILNKILIIGVILRAVLFAVEALIYSDNILYIAVRSFLAAAALLLAGLLCRLVMPKSIGFGDLKLFVVMGLYLGTDHLWNAIFFTLLTAFFYSLFLLVTKKATRKSVIPFAPFLLLGTLLASCLTGV